MTMADIDAFTPETASPMAAIWSSFIWMGVELPISVLFTVA